MDVAVALLVSVLAGTHIATWGAYKDAPHEGFSRRTYLRAIVLASAIGLPVEIWAGFSLTRFDHAVLFFGAVYAAERALEELYKTFLREQDQSKYTIPMQFHVLGRVVHSRLARWSVAGAWALAVGALAVAVVRLEAARGTDSGVVAVVTIGSLGGWLSAVGGAAKDAPIEGFEFLKFLRSPVIAAVWAYPLGHLSRDLLLIPLAAIGYTVATIETYKTFFFPARPRGKFAGKPVLYPGWLVQRRRCVPLYAAIWALMLGAMVAALAGPHSGRL